MLFKSAHLIAGERDVEGRGGVGQVALAAGRPGSTATR